MRLVLFTDTYPPDVNGVARTLGHLVRHLSRRGVEVGLVTPSTAREDPDVVAFHHKLPGIPLPKYQELLLARPLDRKGKGRLAAFQPDLVHIATESTIGWSGRRWARRNRVRLVSSFHTDWPAYMAGYGLGGLEPAVWWGIRKFHAPARITFCPSRATQRQLEEKGFRQEVRIWSRGVDTELFSPSRRRKAFRNSVSPGAEKILLYVGRLAPEKRLDLLFEAFRMVRARVGPEVALVLVGDGPQRAVLEAKASKGVHFAGYRSGADLSEAFASADIFAFPSDTETFGNVVIEALASGLPVVAPNEGGVTESVLPGQTGLLFEAGSPSDFSESLVSLLTDPAKRDFLAQGARELALNRSWASVLDRLLQDYEEALMGHPPNVHLDAASG